MGAGLPGLVLAARGVVMNDLTPSSALLAAAASTRSPSDVLLAKLAPRPCWDVWVLPQADEPWRLEMTLAQHTNEAAAMDVVTNVADRFRLAVIHTDADGKRHDVSETFARKLAEEMASEGFCVDTISGYAFVGVHICTSEIERMQGVDRRAW